MFPRRRSLLEVGVNCKLVSSSSFEDTLEYVAVLVECCVAGRGFYLICFIFDCESLSWVEVALTAHYLIIVDMYICESFSIIVVVFHFHILIFYFGQLAPATFVVVRVVY